MSSIYYVHDGILSMIADNTEDPYSRFLAMRLLKDCIKIGNNSFNMFVQDPHKGVLNILRQIIYERRDEDVEEYGKYFFVHEVNLKQRADKYDVNDLEKLG